MVKLIKVNDDVHKKLKKNAIEQDANMKEIVEEILDRELDDIEYNKGDNDE